MNAEETKPVVAEENLPTPADNGKKKKEKPYRRVKTVSPMEVVVPFIMRNRIGAQNLINTKFEVTKLDEYIRRKREEGMTNLTYMHVIIAAYVRVVSQRPAVNRFVRGQRIYTRSKVDVSLDVKKEMSIDSPDTCLKFHFAPDATLEEVYDTVNTAITDYRNAPGGDFDETAKAFAHLPRFVFRTAMAIIRKMDYYGLLPKALEEVSPFHCSMFITSMGSLGIPPIYHHLYDFGNCPAFVAFGAKRRENVIADDGSVERKSYVDMCFTLEERICDGYYFASALKVMRGLLRDPSVLEARPEKIVRDIP